jgi:hypothetical protein
LSLKLRFNYVNLKLPGMVQGAPDLVNYPGVISLSVIPPGSP